MIERSDGRLPDQMREVAFELDFVPYPEGSVLIRMGNTRVLCNLTIQDEQPRWMTGRTGGWITAEYALLPRSTHTRTRRDNASSSRSQEIKRLIGRSLRAAFDLEALGPRTCILDCDVLQADGGTRTASITGGYLALAMALNKLVAEGELSQQVFRAPVAAVSVGMLDGQPVLDLCYQEDSRAGVDLNVVMNVRAELVEIQGTAEGAPFSRAQLDAMLNLAWSGIRQLLDAQNQALTDLRR